jgi:hypothetical protein
MVVRDQESGIRDQYIRIVIDLLDKALAQGWSVQKFRAEMRSRMPPSPGDEPKGVSK